ncbi:ABC transporter ATP-binding protein [Paeniclostridium sordellii]|uniref:ABC transporter ATP-binding protein n=1 Tax=Paraclostridium sordellii TaxID=1505 RepID=UPI002149DFE1|nr:ABC transporter ATP-binding protein [Paeniclostridium sordellii]MCR1847916.1 ABC transporter ATP-binding protein [Paeniclostridium sordellii]
MELKIENLYKSYKNKEALKNINIIMNAGTYGLLGENGAGKSTLMKILTTIDFQTKGKITFNGDDIVELDEIYREVIGYMPQDYNVFSSFTATDFLEYMGTLKGLSKEELNKKIPEVLEFVNLSHVANKKVKSFSGGMKRRIGIAQAILNDPKILILDEPTSGLDPKERIRFSNIISEMSEDKIVILSTHILSDIEAIANDLIIIRQGEVVEADNIDNLVEKVKGKVWEVLVDKDMFNKLSAERKIIHRKQEGKSILARYVGEKYQGIENKAVEPTLEDYYVANCL